MFLGVLDCIQLDGSVNDENLTIKRQGYTGTISLAKLFGSERLHVKGLIEKIYTLGIDRHPSKPTASIHEMQQYVYGSGALSKQQLDQCVAYCLMIERGQIKLAEAENE